MAWPRRKTDPLPPLCQVRGLGPAVQRVVEERWPGLRVETSGGPSDKDALRRREGCSDGADLPAGRRGQRDGFFAALGGGGGVGGGPVGEEDEKGPGPRENVYTPFPLSFTCCALLLFLFFLLPLFGKRGSRI